MTSSFAHPQHSDRPLRRLITNLYNSWFPSKSSRQADQAEIAYRAAKARYMDRCDKGDDRGAGEVWQDLYRAQTARLRAELGR